MATSWRRLLAEARRYRKAQRMLEAGERRAEAELSAYVVGELEAGTLDPIHLEEYGHHVACDIADGADDRSLDLLNEVLDVVFDPRPVDPDLLAEDPEGAYITQIMLGYQDHLDFRLQELIEAAGVILFGTGVVPTGTRPLRH